jgi:primase-polymerase (primpol)-like protein
MKTQVEKNIPCSQLSYATEPTGWTKFWRTSFLKQIIRFFVLNLKIMRIVVGGHS